MAIIQFDENILKQIVSDTIKEYDRQQREKRERKRDRRLRNTDLLLRNYNNLLTHIEYAVEDEKKLDEDDPDKILYSIEEEVNSEEEYEGIYISAIKRTKTRTRIILKHIDSAIEFYKQKAMKLNSESLIRRYEVVCKYYFEGTRISVIAEELNCSDKTIGRDKKKAVEELSVLFFGIDGIKFTI